MKKIIIPVLTFILIGSAVMAANQQGAGQQGAQGTGAPAEGSQQSQETGQGQQVQTEQQTQNQGEVQQIRTEQQTQTRAGEPAEVPGLQNLISVNQQKASTVTQAREIVQQKKQEMAQEMQGLSNVQQKVYQNQNKVREAVQALLSLEDLAPGIGPQVSQIATQFNNSVQATISAEEKIQKKNLFVRIFTGGDKDAAGDMERELNQNQLRIQELNQLKEGCASCSEEVKAMMQEQILNMEQEQVRLQQLANREKSANGLFGWVRNMFGWGR